ncbi:MAG: hypothetical protein AAB573_05510 [Patescibacteria group bacterium]
MTQPQEKLLAPAMTVLKGADAARVTPEILVQQVMESDPTLVRRREAAAAPVLTEDEKTKPIAEGVDRHPDTDTGDATLAADDEPEEPRTVAGVTAEGLFVMTLARGVVLAGLSIGLFYTQLVGSIAAAVSVSPFLVAPILGIVAMVGATYAAYQLASLIDYTVVGSGAAIGRMVGITKHKPSFKKINKRYTANFKQRMKNVIWPS